MRLLSVKAVAVRLVSFKVCDGGRGASCQARRGMVRLVRCVMLRLRAPLVEARDGETESAPCGQTESAARGYG